MFIRQWNCSERVCLFLNSFCQYTLTLLLVAIHIDSCSFPLVVMSVVIVMNELADCLRQQEEFTESLQLLLRSRNILTQVSPVSGVMGKGKHFTVM